jgi:hypothetical protein
MVESLVDWLKKIFTNEKVTQISPEKPGKVSDFAPKTPDEEVVLTPMGPS